MAYTNEQLIRIGMLAAREWQLDSGQVDIMIAPLPDSFGTALVRKRGQEHFIGVDYTEDLVKL